MNCVTRPLLYGVAAGAAGSTALNAVGYADIALRGRPVSTPPEVTVRKLAEKLHVKIPGQGPTLDNRVVGLAALTGIAVGVGMGAVLSLARTAGWHPSNAPEYAIATVGALICTNAPITALGLTDPRTWSASDWASDIAPHLAYALVTTAVFERMYTGGVGCK